MAEYFDLHPGLDGAIVATKWDTAAPRYVVLLCHGYGEHMGRYEHVAVRFLADGAAVYGQDHRGHGRSAGERVLMTDAESLVEDFHALSDVAHRDHPGVPLVLVGHSMGGMLAARYLQRHGSEITAAVLSAPVITGGLVRELLSLDELPTDPLDPNALSRDPAVGAAYAADPLVYHGGFRRRTLEAWDRMITTIAGGGRFTVPVLWIHGTSDPLVNYEETADMWQELKGPVAAQRPYLGARHEVFNETNKDEVLADVLQWINGVLPAQAPGTESGSKP